MCDEDARDEEAGRFRSLARGDQHEVTMDVTVRITVWALGSTHKTDDLEDLITCDALAYESEIMNIEEVG